MTEGTYSKFDFDPEALEWARGRARALFAVGLDAVFPGWREGKLQFGLLAPNGNVHGPISNRVTAESAAFTNDRLVSRWVGPWVPVEEGTDG